MSNPGEWYSLLPPVTKIWWTTAVLSALGVKLRLLSEAFLLYTPGLVFSKRMQVRRRCLLLKRLNLLANWELVRSHTCVDCVYPVITARLARKCHHYRRLSPLLLAVVAPCSKFRIFRAHKLRVATTDDHVVRAVGAPHHASCSCASLPPNALSCFLSTAITFRAARVLVQGSLRPRV